MSIIDEIENQIIRGYESLTKSLRHHWPLQDDDFDNEISEANIVLHVGNAFLSATEPEEYSAFSEYRINGDQHLDLKIIPSSKKYEIIGECKRFLKTDGTAISKDIVRMASISPYEDRDLYGIVLAMSQKPAIGEWWENTNRGEYPDGGYRAEEWPLLFKLIQKHNIKCGAVAIGYHGEDGYHKGLYGIFKIKP